MTFSGKISDTPRCSADRGFYNNCFGCSSLEIRTVEFPEAQPLRLECLADLIPTKTLTQTQDSVQKPLNPFASG